MEQTSSLVSWLFGVTSFLFGEFLHILNFLSYFLCNCVHPFLMWGFSVVFSDYWPELFKFFHFKYLSFQHLRFLCLSIEHSLVFLKHFVITYPCVFDLYVFHLYIAYLNLSNAFSFTHMSFSFLFNWWYVHFSSFSRISFSFFVDFLLIFPLWISFVIQARICLNSLICLTSLVSSYLVLTVFYFILFFHSFSFLNYLDHSIASITV